MCVCGVCVCVRVCMWCVCVHVHVVCGVCVCMCIYICLHVVTYVCLCPSECVYIDVHFTAACRSRCHCPTRWFHGSVTRFEAEKLLDRNRLGQFLVRSTQHGKGVFAVSLRCVAVDVWYVCSC